jgi:hypothetical protein
VAEQCVERRVHAISNRITGWISGAVFVLFCLVSLSEQAYVSAVLFALLALLLSPGYLSASAASFRPQAVTRCRAPRRWDFAVIIVSSDAVILARGVANISIYDISNYTTIIMHDGAFSISMSFTKLASFERRVG